PGRHPDPTHRAMATRRPHPGADLAVVLPPRRHTVRCGQAVAGLPAPLRPGTHIPPVQADPGLDQTETAGSGRGGSLDLADHRRLHPTAAGPDPDHRPTPPLATTRPRRPTQPRPGPPRISVPPAEDHPPSRCTETQPTRPRTPTRL